MPVLTVQMTRQDLARLDELARKTHRTRSDVVRAVLSRVQVLQPDLAVPSEIPSLDDALRPEVSR
jgi:hypothetical protein